MNSYLKNNCKYGLAALAAAFCWGLASVVIKISLQSFSPLYSMALRFTLAALCFLLVFHKRIFSNLPRLKWLPCLAVGACLSIMNVTVHYSLMLTSATNATFFYSIPAIFTPFFGFLLFRHRFKASHLLIVAMIIAGLYMLCNTENGFSFGWGEFLGMISSISFALGMVLQNHYLADTDTITAAAVEITLIALVGWMIALPVEGIMDFSAVTTSGWLSLLYMGIFGAFVAYVCQTLALNNMNADFVSVILTMEPVFTAVIAYFVLNETLTPIAMAGAALIIIGVVLVTLRGNK